MKLFRRNRVSQRSRAPGRERWSVDELWRKPDRANHVSKMLAQCQGITLANANANTGRILVVFDLAQLEDSVECLILRALDGGAEQTSPSNRKQRAQVGASPLNSISKKNKGENLLGLIKAVETQRSNRLRGMALSVGQSFFYLTTAVALAIVGLAVVAPTASVLKLFGFRSLLGRISFWSGVVLFSKGMESFLEHRAKKEWQQYAGKIEQTLRIASFEHIEKLDMSFLENQSSGKLINLINGDTAKIKRFLERTPDSSIRKITAFGGVCLFFAFVSPILIPLTLFPLPFIYFYSKRFPQKVARRYEDLSTKADYLNHLLANSLSGLPTIKSYTSEEYEKTCLSSVGEELMSKSIDVNSASAQHAIVLQYAGNVGLVASLGFGGLMVGAGTLSMTTYMIQSILVTRVLMSMTDLGSDFHLYQESVAAANRLITVLDTESKIVDGDLNFENTGLKNKISFEGVNFAYDNRATTLVDLDLTIPANQTTAFVGSTGSGKTTLIKLLLRFYDVDKGQILLDDINLKRFKLQDLREAIGFVSQDVYMFHGTVYENIAFGKPDARRDEVISAARKAEALNFITNLPDGFDTVIGERGQKLSGGQRQRLSIARALLKNPPILIFDEATSSVDNETEAAIQRSIKRIAAGRTTILIAHRLSTVRNAQSINLLENGTIREKGTHDQLMTLDGAYANLWKVQTGEIVTPPERDTQETDNVKQNVVPFQH